MNDLFTNREIAAALTAFVFFGLSAFFAQRKNGDLLSITMNVLRAAYQLKLLIPMILFLAISMLAVLLASEIGLWNTSLWKPTILWLLFSGGALYFKSTEALKKPTFFRDKAKQSIGAMVLVQYIATSIHFHCGSKSSHN